MMRLATRGRGARRARPAIAIAITLLASGAVAVAPRAGAATVQGPTVALAHVVVQGEGFDACEAPPSSTMRAWLTSPFRTVNIYFGGSERYCRPGGSGPQRYLSAEWVRTVTANGWGLIPTYVGRQAPCYGGTKKKISTDPATAQAQGKFAADDAVDGTTASTSTSLRQLHIPRHSPAYIDIENFPAGNATCDKAVRRFLLGWIDELRARGYRAGVYGLPTGAIRVLVSSHKVNSSYPIPDAIWFARYDGVDSTRSADIPSTYLTNHRIHQYAADLNRTYAGLTLNIDKDAMNGDVVRSSSVSTPSGPPYAYAAEGSPNTSYTTPGSINLRTTPSAPADNSNLDGTVVDGQSLSIECQTVGQTINGDYVWDKIHNPNTADLAHPDLYISDLYTNTTGGNGVSSAIAHCETTPPTVTVTPLPAATLHPTVTVSYSARDKDAATGTNSGIGAYDVRYRQASDRSGFGSWHYPAGWQKTKSRTATLSLAPGGTYCVQVRAYDRLTNRSRWSPETCIARALDDRAFAATTAWRRSTGSGYYLRTVTTTKTAGANATRSGEQLLRLGIVATRCATCGKVRLYVAGQRVGVIDLTASSVQRRRILMLPVFSSLRSGMVRIRVMSSGRTVQLDGVVISRR